MEHTIATVLTCLIIAEGAIFALAARRVKEWLMRVPEPLLAAAGVAELLIGFFLLYLLASA